MLEKVLGTELTSVLFNILIVMLKLYSYTLVHKWDVLQGMKETRSEQWGRGEKRDSSEGEVPQEDIISGATNQ